MENFIDGKVMQGRRSASGLNGREYGGTITNQKPYFKSAGVDRVDSWYEGTINMDISPKEFKILKPDYVVTAEWAPDIEETFWFVDVKIKHKGVLYSAYVYYPLPSKVKAHPDTTVELLAEKIESINYGDDISLEFSPDSIIISE